MLLLWSLLAIGEILVIAAGAQAVRLMRNQDGRISWLQTQMTAKDEQVASTQRQLDVHKLLLQQAGVRLEQQKKELNSADQAPALNAFTHE